MRWMKKYKSKKVFVKGIRDDKHCTRRQHNNITGENGLAGPRSLNNSDVEPCAALTDSSTNRTNSINTRTHLFQHKQRLFKVTRRISNSRAGLAQIHNWQLPAIHWFTPLQLINTHSICTTTYLTLV